jgi:hypothetical protein
MDNQDHDALLRKNSSILEGLLLSINGDEDVDSIFAAGTLTTLPLLAMPVIYG